MTFTAQQIAGFLGGEVAGNPLVEVSDLSKIEEGRPGTLTFLSNPKYTHFIYTTKADVVLVNDSFVPEQPISATLIKVPNAYEALGKLLNLVESMKPKKSGVHELAFVDSSAKIGENCYVGPFAYIGAGASIGNNSKIYPHVFVGDQVIVGDDVTLYHKVTIYDQCVVGNRAIIHAGAVIGADGFGFAPDAEGRYNKIPQIGNVVIDDDVEVGANATIDRATMGSTHIHRGVKIDNLVQLAHNVEVGEDTAIASQSGVAGSTKIGKRCIFAGQVGAAGHITIADGSIFGAQTGVPNSIKEPNQVWMGYPALPAGTFRRSAVVYKNLSDLQRKVHELEKKLNALSESNV